MSDQASAAQTVLIVDDDIGFVWWLGDILNEAGCKALPALTSEEAIDITKRLGLQPDLIIFNPTLAEAGRVLQIFLQAKPDLKIVTIGSGFSELTTSTHVRGVLERPAASEPILRADWLQKVRRLLKKVEAAAG
jgi:ActR/RegA family two-component response regulator